ncbi:zinc-dependent metalloprotease [Microbacterium betulae]|uniref:Zinc-dependent metalloprotease n=1 Tax=Microbacterium betulae TaxID=2981139 RepID=A0AA97I6W4_9MICO|nr:zinc-dependent metalloprotease [Microbacterium sp. AB]WOF23042.1 zinc-dependent metalloprotease [Microbacterium sp. AB]
MTFRTRQHDDRLLLALPSPAGHTLLYGALERGLGSSRLPLDRGFPTPVLLVRWHVSGEAVVWEALPHGLGVGKDVIAGADVTGPAADAAVDDSFAASVIARTPLVDAEGGPWTDPRDLLLADPFRLGESLSSAPWGGRPRAEYSVDAARSGVLAAGADALAGELVYRRGRELPAGDDVRLPGSVTGPDAAAEPSLPSDGVGLRLRAWFAPAASAAAPLAHHPRSGGSPIPWRDFRRSDRAEAAVQPRFRPGEPVEYLVDPGIPEPYRTAVLDGLNWWREPFAEHGIDFRARLPQKGEDLWGARTNVVVWVHRTGRGWSLGGSQSVPFTGEILRGTVRLGSERILQLRQLFETILQPFGAPDEAERLARIEEALLGRLRQLAAHEVGHSLGFSHNFATHVQSSPSVLDYPFPDIGLDDGGAPVLVDAYRDGLGDWDAQLLRHAYAAAPAQDALATLTEGESAHATGAAPWVAHRGAADPLAALDHLLRVRGRAIASFGPSAAPGHVQQGELRERFVRLFLLHRFQADEVTSFVGGADYAYGTVDDLRRRRTAVTDAALQRRALAAAADLLRADVIAVPDEVTALLAPSADRYVDGQGATPSLLGRLFDPVALSGAAAAVVVLPLLGVERLNRIWLQNVRDAELPGVAEVVSALASAASDAPAGASVTGGAGGYAVLHAAVHALASDRLHAGARDALRGVLGAWPDARLAAQALSARDAVERDPAAARRYAVPVVPAGAPL